MSWRARWVGKRTLFIAAVFMVIAGLAIGISGVLDNEAAPLPDQTWTVTKPTPEVSPAPVGDAKVTADTMAAGKLLIPSLGVYATVVPEVISGGELTLPWHTDVALARSAGAIDSLTGTVVLAGHVSSYGYPGALKWLSRLQPGARFYVTDGSRFRSDWVATGMETYLKADLPADLFYADGPRRAAIITCGGPVITRADGSHHYRDNVVVYGTQIDSTQIEGRP